MKPSISDHFKPYLTVEGGYKGGKAVPPGATGRKTYKLSSNENPIGPSPKAIAAMRAVLEGLHIYPDATDERLRDALAVYHRFNLTSDQFLTAPGGSELIDLVARAFLREGDEVLISTPCFVPYRTFSTWMGARVVDVPLLHPPAYQLDVAGILKAVTPRTRIVFLTSPNNPTGTYIVKADFEQLLEKLPSDVLVVYDEVYWHFVTAADFTTAEAYVATYPNLLAVNSFSKAFGLPALRVGYAYGHVELTTYLRQIIKPFFIPATGLAGSIAALGDQEFIRQTVDLVLGERAWLAEQYDQLGLTYSPSQANFYLLDPPVPARRVVEFLKQEGIAVRPMENFGAPGKVRISIGNREANEAMLRALKKVITK